MPFPSHYFLQKREGPSAAGQEVPSLASFHPSFSRHATSGARHAALSSSSSSVAIFGGVGRNRPGPAKTALHHFICSPCQRERGGGGALNPFLSPRGHSREGGRRLRWLTWLTWARPTLAVMAFVPPLVPPRGLKTEWTGGGGRQRWAVCLKEGGGFREGGGRGLPAKVFSPRCL